MTTAPPTRLVVLIMLALPAVRGHEAGATFPGANGRIAFERGDAAREVFVMDASGGGQTNLTNDPLADDSEARWSPDGSQLLFESDRTGNREIFLVNAGGGSARQLTEHPATDVEPSWSPDGSQILFQSDRDGNVEIYVMSANGGSATRLTNHPMDDDEPTWSPDGTRILFHSDREGNPDVFVMNANGGGQTNLTNNPAADDNASWSPVSSRIVFDSDRDGDFEIYVMNANGSGQTRITTVPGSDRQPVWSPDGTRIAFESDRDGNQEIYVMAADGSNQTRLTSNTVPDSEPDWGPAGSDLSIELTDDDHGWNANPLIPYRITVTAQDMAQTNLVVREIVPVNTTFSAADSTPGWTCDPGPQAESACSFPLGSLAAGESRALMFAARVADGTDPLWEVLDEASVNPQNWRLTLPREGTIVTGVQICVCDMFDIPEEQCHLTNPRSRARQAVAGDLDVILYYRARDRVLHQRSGGRRLTQLAYQHVGDGLTAVAAAPQVGTLGLDAFVAWQPVIQALVDGTGATATITDAQVQAALAFLDALRAASPALRPVIDRERILFDASGLAGTTAEQWLARADRLSCERAQTFASVRCRVDELARLVQGGGASGTTAKRLRAALAKAAARAEAGERADAQGKARPRRAALRKVGSSLAALGKRLRSKRAARDVGEDLRALLLDQSAALRNDVTALTGS